MLRNITQQLMMYFSSYAAYKQMIGALNKATLLSEVAYFGIDGMVFSTDRQSFPSMVPPGLKPSLDSITELFTAS